MGSKNFRKFEKLAQYATSPVMQWSVWWRIGTHQYMLDEDFRYEMAINLSLREKRWKLKFSSSGIFRCVDFF